MYSTDGGDTWTDPEVFTPVTTPLLDFRHVSIVPVAPVSPADDDIITVHLAMQGDPMQLALQTVGNNASKHYSSVLSFYY